MNPFKATYGPWALITGASSGIGAEFARALAGRGLNLVLVARREARLRDLARDLEVAHSIAVKVVPVDLTAPDFLPTIQQATEGLEIGLLVNNAGVMPTGRFLDNDLEHELRQLDLNVRAPLILTHAFGRQMAERGRGGILFLASLVAFQGTPLVAHYAATKAFDLILAEGLHAELKQAGIDVLALAPGFTDTHLAGDLDFSNSPVKPMPVEPVVQRALDALGRKAVVIPGGQNRLLAWMGKHLLPRSANTAIYGRIFGALVGA